VLKIYQNKKKCIRLWTDKKSGIYKDLNVAIMNDDADKLIQYMPCIINIVSHIQKPSSQHITINYNNSKPLKNNKNKNKNKNKPLKNMKSQPVLKVNKHSYNNGHNDLITFRGSKITNKQFKVYKPEMVARFAMFVSTTKNRSKALNWPGTTTLIKFIISQDHCQLYDKDIKSISCFPDEEEVLLPPYTPFRVIKIINGSLFRPKEIVVRVLNFQEVEDQEKNNKLFHVVEETNEYQDQLFDFRLPSGIRNAFKKAPSDSGVKSVFVSYKRDNSLANQLQLRYL